MDFLNFTLIIPILGTILTLGSLLFLFQVEIKTKKVKNKTVIFLVVFFILLLLANVILLLNYSGILKIELLNSLEKAQTTINIFTILISLWPSAFLFFSVQYKKFKQQPHVFFVLFTSVVSNVVLFYEANTLVNKDLTEPTKWGKALTDAIKPVFFEYRFETLFENLEKYFTPEVGLPLINYITIPIIILSVITSASAISSVILLVYSIVKRDLLLAKLKKQNVIYIFGYEKKYEYLLNSLRESKTYEKYTIILALESNASNINATKNYFENEQINQWGNIIVEDYQVGNGLIAELLSRHDLGKNLVVLSLYGDDKQTTKLLVSFTKFLKENPIIESDNSMAKNIKGYFGLNSIKSVKDWDTEISSDNRLHFYSYPELASLDIVERFSYSKTKSYFEGKNEDLEVKKIKYIFIGFSSVAQSTLKNLLILNQNDSINFSYNIISKDENENVNYRSKKFIAIKDNKSLNQFKLPISILRYSKLINSKKSKYLPLGIDISYNNDFIDKNVNYFTEDVNSLNFLNLIEQIVGNDSGEIVEFIINTGDDFSNINIASKLRNYVIEEKQIENKTKIITIVKDKDLINVSKSSSFEENLVNYSGSYREIMTIENIFNDNNEVSANFATIIEMGDKEKSNIDLTNLTQLSGSRVNIFDYYRDELRFAKTKKKNDQDFIAKLKDIISKNIEINFSQINYIQKNNFDEKNILDYINKKFTKFEKESSFSVIIKNNSSKLGKLIEKFKKEQMFFYLVFINSNEILVKCKFSDKETHFYKIINEVNHTENLEDSFNKDKNFAKSFKDMLSDISKALLSHKKLSLENSESEIKRKIIQSFFIEISDDKHKKKNSKSDVLEYKIFAQILKDKITLFNYYEAVKKTNKIKNDYFDISKIIYDENINKYFSKLTTNLADKYIANYFVSQTSKNIAEESDSKLKKASVFEKIRKDLEDKLLLNDEKHNYLIFNNKFYNGEIKKVKMNFSFSLSISNNLIFKAIKTNLALLDIDIVLKDENINNIITPYQYYYEKYKLMNYPKFKVEKSDRRKYLDHFMFNTKDRFNIVKNVFNSHKMLSLFNGKIPVPLNGDNLINKKKQYYNNNYVKNIASFNSYIKYYSKSSFDEVNKYIKVFDSLPFIVAKSGYKLINKKKKSELFKYENSNGTFYVKRLLRRFYGRLYLIIFIKEKINPDVSYLFAQHEDELYYAKSNNIKDLYLKEDKSFESLTSILIDEKTRKDFISTGIKIKVNKDKSLLLVSANDNANEDSKDFKADIMSKFNGINGILVNNLVSKKEFSKLSKKNTEITFELDVKGNEDSFYKQVWTLQKIKEQGFEVFIKDNKVHVKNYFGFNSNIFIPSEIDSKKVVIEKGAFQFNEFVEKLYISNDVEVAEFSFSFCENLKKVWVGDGCKLSSNCFYNSPIKSKFYFVDYDMSTNYIIYTGMKKRRKLRVAVRINNTKLTFKKKYSKYKDSPFAFLKNS